MIIELSFNYCYHISPTVMNYKSSLSSLSNLRDPTTPNYSKHTLYFLGFPLVLFEYFALFILRVKSFYTVDPCLQS